MLACWALRFLESCQKSQHWRRCTAGEKRHPHRYIAFCNNCELVSLPDNLANEFLQFRGLMWSLHCHRRWFSGKSDVWRLCSDIVDIMDGRSWSIAEKKKVTSKSTS